MMARTLFTLLFPAGLCLLIASPAAAGLVLSNVVFTPEAPLVPGGHEAVAATYAVIPGGSETFARGHSLQMQTNLEGAKWTIQVTLDGRDAARQTASGSAAFVNGEVLAYSTDHDVGLVVTVAGTVPANATAPISMLAVRELDNNGNTVPGSTLDISQPVAGSVSAPPASTVQPPPAPSVETTAATPRSPGFGPVMVFAGIATGALTCRAGARKRHTGEQSLLVVRHVRNRRPSCHKP